MSEIVLRILDGTDRGRVFQNLSTPITIGREEGNVIQLNDERVSRFHLKIQVDRDKVVLTDLQSTNGTRVNGEDIQLRILRHGDLINIGRSVVLFGSHEQIAARLAELRQNNRESQTQANAKISSEGTASQHGQQPQSDDFNFELNWNAEYDFESDLHQLRFPSLPTELGPAQTAQLSELLEFIHIRLRDIMSGAKVKGPLEMVLMQQEHWQALLELQDKLAQSLKVIGDPPSE